MAWPPAVADFKAKFVREFVYGTGLDSVIDSDIQRAIDEAGDGTLFTQSNFDSIPQQTTAFLYLTAHLMVLNIQGAGGLSAIARGRGVRNVSEGVVNSKGVGGVNVGYQPPAPRTTTSELRLGLMRTDFGKRYLQMLENRLVGNIAVVAGYDDITHQAVNRGNPI